MSNFDSKTDLPVRSIMVLIVISLGIVISTLLGIKITVTETIDGAGLGQAFVDGLRLGSALAATLTAVCSCIYAAACGRVSGLSEHQETMVLRLVRVFDAILGAAVLLLALTCLGYYLDFFHSLLTVPLALLLTLALPLTAYLSQVLLLMWGQHGQVPVRSR